MEKEEDRVTCCGGKGGGGRRTWEGARAGNEHRGRGAPQVAFFPARRREVGRSLDPEASRT
jgi:hypothetical protein